jgi:hypothetical protein
MMDLGVKRRGFKKLTVRCAAIIGALDEGGPLLYSELAAVTHIPEGSLDRYLGHMMELGFIGRVGRRYCLRSDILVYENKTDRDLALCHSKHLASGLLSKLQVGMFRIGEGYLAPDPMHWPSMQEHLRSAVEYAAAYRNLAKAEKANGEAIDDGERMKRVLTVRLLDAKLGLVDGEHTAELLANEILDDIGRLLRGEAPRLVSSLRVEDGQVRSGFAVLVQEADQDRLKRFVSKELSSEENKRSCREIEAKRKEYGTSWGAFSKSSDELIQKVLNGTPLSGRCSLCPKVVTITKLPADE